MTKSKILLEILTECQHCRTITQVAQKLYVSQPYVSQILQNAEQQYQVTLVDRETLPIQVTLAGKRLLKYLIQLTDDENALNQEMALFANKHQGKISVTFNQPFATVMAPELFSDLEAAFPDVLFEFDEQTTYLAVQNLLANQTRLFVGSIPTNQEIYSLTVTHDEFPLILVPKNNPIYPKINVNASLTENLNLFENADFIGLSGQSYYQDILDRIFTDHNIDVNIRLQVPNTISATLTALHSSSITATLPFVLPRLQIPSNQYKLVPIPRTLFNARLGVSYRQDADQLVVNIARVLQQLIARFYTEHGKQK